MKKRFVGIDYGLTSPAMTILGTDDSFIHGQTYFLTSTKKFVGKFNNINGSLHDPYIHVMDRYEKIAMNFRQHLHYGDVVFLEDYSMGSTGKVFHIAEATSILKYHLYLGDISYTLVPPTVIKKYATGKGNADKNSMYNFFLQKNSIDLQKVLCQNSAILKSPISDIVDSYWIACYGKDHS